jgi:predicted PurR-regulated permease PerM
MLPLVKWLKDRHVPTFISSVVLVVAVLIVPILVIFGIVGPVVEQGRELSRVFPELIEDVEGRFSVNVSQEIESRAEMYGEQILGSLLIITGSVFQLIVNLILILVMTVYWLIYFESFKNGVLKLFSLNKKKEKIFKNTFVSIEERLSQWAKGQLFLSVSVGVLTWVILVALGIPYALLLAALAALLEIIPTLGPILAAVPALIIAITISLQMFIVILIAYVVIQQIESYIIAPRLLGNTVRLNPFVILVAIIVGAHLLGIIGALIAVPVVLIGQEIYKSYDTELAS